MWWGLATSCKPYQEALTCLVKQSLCTRRSVLTGLEGIPSVLPIGKYKTTALRLLEGKTGVTKGSNFWELQGEHPNLQKKQKGAFPCYCAAWLTHSQSAAPLLSFTTSLAYLFSFSPLSGGDRISSRARQ